MKQRAIAFTLIFSVALIALWASEHAKPNANLPLVDASWRPPAPNDSRLYANCPVTPWARPTHSKEHIV